MQSGERKSKSVEPQILSLDTSVFFNIYCKIEQHYLTHNKGRSFESIARYTFKGLPSFDKAAYNY